MRNGSALKVKSRFDAVSDVRRTGSKEPKGLAGFHGPCGGRDAWAWKTASARCEP